PAVTEDLSSQGGRAGAQPCQYREPDRRDGRVVAQPPKDPFASRCPSRKQPLLLSGRLCSDPEHQASQPEPQRTKGWLARDEHSYEPGRELRRAAPDKAGGVAA